MAYGKERIPLGSFLIIPPPDPYKVPCGLVGVRPRWCSSCYLSWMCGVRLPAELEGLHQTQCLSLYRKVPRAQPATLHKSLLAIWLGTEKGGSAFIPCCLPGFELCTFTWLISPNTLPPIDCSFSHIGFCKLSGGKYYVIACVKTMQGKITSSIWWSQVYNGLPFPNERWSGGALAL